MLSMLVTYIPMIGRSREGAWIEIPITLAILLISYGRSREGAWIEIYCYGMTSEVWTTVAPARERGLKYMYKLYSSNHRLVAPARERGLKYRHPKYG